MNLLFLENTLVIFLTALIHLDSDGKPAVSFSQEWAVLSTMCEYMAREHL